MSDALPLDEAAVADWLRQHPEFFQRHEELLTEITVPHETGAAVSLVERQVAVLRERNVELRDRLHKLLDVARENDQLFEKTRGLILSLLEARNLPELSGNLYSGLRERFQSEYVSLLVFDTGLDALGGAIETTLAEAQEKVPGLIRGQRALAGQLRKEELLFLFADNAASVASCAVVPVQLGRSLGLLAIGSSQADHFKSSMDTLFISYIGDVLARLLTPFLNTGAARRTA
jgi:uncharacterized protein YigA (DUF484 family)